MKSFSFLFLFLTISCASPSSQKDSCEAIRGGIDVGSGSMKALVAKVDFCEGKILSVLFSEQFPVKFKEALSQSSDQKIDRQTIQTAREKFQTLLSQMNSFNPQRIRAVATSALREAHNGLEVTDALTKGTNIKIDIISQDQEALLGYHSAWVKAPKGLSKKNVVVWDIGGGSMQISYQSQQGYQVFKGQLASVSFKDQVISQIQKKNPKVKISPNPLGPSARKAIQLSMDHGRKNLPKDLLAEANHRIWLGIGGVWWHSVRNQVGSKNEFLQIKEVQSALERISALSDEQIGGDYASTEATNLALTLGYMKALKIDQVRPIKASLVEGLLFDATSSAGTTH